MIRIPQQTKSFFFFSACLSPFRFFSSHSFVPPAANLVGEIFIFFKTFNCQYAYLFLALKCVCSSLPCLGYAALRFERDRDWLYIFDSKAIADNQHVFEFFDKISSTELGQKILLRQISSLSLILFLILLVFDLVFIYSHLTNSS